MNLYRKKSCIVLQWIRIGVTSILIVLISQAYAGAPEIRGNCRDKDNLKIFTKYDTNIKEFAEVRMIPRFEQQQAREHGLSPFVIYVNPKRYYLSQYTQQWLYHRQCILIKYFPNEAMRRDSRINIGLEEQLDCLAVQLMKSEPETDLSARQIQSVERDMERVLHNNRWGEVLVGPERRIRLMHCE